MGTRNLICVVKDGEYRVAQYGQWDGYPTGQGERVVRFLMTADRAKFSDQVDKVRHLNSDEVNQRWLAAGLDRTQFLDKAIRAPVMHLDRDCGSGILDYVLNAEDPEVFMSTEFAGDSLFCEYCYVANLDSESLEVFVGFNKQPLTESDRFYGYERFNKDRDDKYYTVRLVASYPFASLTDRTMDELEKRLSGEDESEDMGTIAQD